MESMLDTIRRLEEEIKQLKEEKENGNRNFKRGDIVYVQFEPEENSVHEEEYNRPCVVVSNDKYNEGSYYIHVVTMSSNDKREDLATHIPMFFKGKRSTICCENLYRVKKEKVQVQESTQRVPRGVMIEVEQGLRTMYEL